MIPKEIRRTLRIRESDPLEIFTDREGEIILKKYSPIGELGTFSREYAEALAQAAGCLVCITDRDQIIGAAGSGSKEYMEKRINRDLEDMISDRKNMRITDGNYVRILEEDKGEYGSQVIYTITCAGDAVGAVVILDKPGRTEIFRYRRKAGPGCCRISGKTDGTVKKQFLPEENV